MLKWLPLTDWGRFLSIVNSSSEEDFVHGKQPGSASVVSVWIRFSNIHVHDAIHSAAADPVFSLALGRLRVESNSLFRSIKTMLTIWFVFRCGRVDEYYTTWHRPLQECRVWTLPSRVYYPLHCRPTMTRRVLYLTPGGGVKIVIDTIVWKHRANMSTLPPPPT